MNDPTIITMVSILAGKLATCETDRVELESHIRRDHETMDDMQRTITDLRTRLEEKYEQAEVMRNRNEELYAQVRKLTSENHQLRFGTGTPEETAIAYMKAQGANVWREGRKIEVFKGVREVTGWSLYETKQFVETYMAPRQEEKEESGPGTKRSSQIPAGVGTNLKKSA